MLHLKLASCMAENTESVCEGVASFIEDQIGIRSEYVTGIPWQERERLFDRGAIQILWLCGLPYVYKADMVESDIELLAVPVPRGERYQARPVYFSDVIVRRDRPFESFCDLRGASWVYNEPRSHSGFNVVRSHLVDIGGADDFFSEVVESGAHSASLEMILAGRVDGAAIDSTVLEWLIAERRELPEQIRVIESLGPSPIPPWVISKRSRRACVASCALCSCACIWTRAAEACLLAPASSASSERRTMTTTRFGSWPGKPSKFRSSSF